MASVSEAETPSVKFSVPDDWSDAFFSIASDSDSFPPVVLVCGAKNCGKTTFARHLLKLLLLRYKAIAYLDTDVGQPEFTPPGFLSLTFVDSPTPDLETPCLKTPESPTTGFLQRSFFFGDISAKRDPAAYLNFVYILYDYYRKEFCSPNISDGPYKQKVPLIINTPGWVKGAGYDMLVDMLKYVSPTHVVKINIYSTSKNLPDGVFWSDDGYHGKLIEINSAFRDPHNKPAILQKKAQQLRDLRMIAYFKQCFAAESDVSTTKELAYALTSHPPYEVPIKSIKIKHLHCQVPESEIFYCLNASIVGLASSSEPSETTPWCWGLGIVRSIDIAKGLLYVITPVPLRMLEKVDLLLMGFVHLPTTLLQYRRRTSPYVSSDILSTM